MSKTVIPENFQYTPNPIQPCKPVTFTMDNTNVRSREMKIYSSEPVPVPGAFGQWMPKYQMHFTWASGNITLIPVFDYNDGAMQDDNNGTVYFFNFEMDSTGDRSCYVNTTASSGTLNNLPPGSVGDLMWISNTPVQCNEIEVNWHPNSSEGPDIYSQFYLSFQFDSTPAIPFMSNFLSYFGAGTTQKAAKVTLPFVGDRTFNWALVDTIFYEPFLTSAKATLSPSNDSSCAVDAWYITNTSALDPPLASTTQAIPVVIPPKPTRISSGVIGGIVVGVVLILFVAGILLRKTFKCRHAVTVKNNSERAEDRLTKRFSMLSVSSTNKTTLDDKRVDFKRSIELLPTQ